VFRNKFLLFIKKIPKNLIFPKGFFLNHVKKIFFDLKSWGPPKKFKIRSGSYSGLALSLNVKKTKLKSRWTVPLSISDRIFLYLQKAACWALPFPSWWVENGAKPKRFTCTKPGTGYEEVPGWVLLRLAR
jgi:hypothetical protein